MIFRRTVGFKREFENLPPEVQKVAREKFAFFRSNWRHPSLRSHIVLRLVNVAQNGKDF